MMIADLHNDILTVCPKKIKEQKLQAKVVCAVWTSKLKKPWQFLEKAREKVEYLAIEDLGFINNDTLPLIADFKPIYASLTWNNQNNLAGGAHSDGRLTQLGAKAITLLEDKNIFLDVAHLNEKSFFDCMKHTSKPIICSHTCFNGVFFHPRNLSYAQAKLIVESGGIVGIALVPQFMGRKRANFFDLVRQIDYFCQRFDYKHLAIGTDFYGCKKPAIANYHDLSQVKYQLLNHGYTLNHIDAIFCKNAIRLIDKQS